MLTIYLILKNETEMVPFPNDEVEFSLPADEYDLKKSIKIGQKAKKTTKKESITNIDDESSNDSSSVKQQKTLKSKLNKDLNENEDGLGEPNDLKKRKSTNSKVPSKSVSVTRAASQTKKKK
jgi:hypothetical protein